MVCRIWKFFASSPLHGTVVGLLGGSHGLLAFHVKLVGTFKSSLNTVYIAILRVLTSTSV